MQVALETLGLRAYKGDELLFYSPLILDYDLQPAKLVAPFQTCGVKAFVGDDTFGLVPKLLEVSPSTKVILTVRSWREWKDAFVRARSGPAEPIFGLLSLLLCNWLPWGMVVPQADIGHSFVKNSMTTMLLQNCILETRKHMVPRSGPRLMVPHLALLHNESFYTEWLDMLRKLVPSDRFMEFDFKKHGWQDLANFLGLAAPPVGTPFPKTMGGTQSNDMLKLQLFPGKFMAFWALMLMSAILHCLALRQIAMMPWLGWLSLARVPGHDKRE